MADVITFTEVYRSSFPCWALLDEELVQWRLKWVGTFAATSQATFGNMFALFVLLCIFRGNLHLRVECEHLALSANVPPN